MAARPAAGRCTTPRPSGSPATSSAPMARAAGLQGLRPTVGAAKRRAVPLGTAPTAAWATPSTACRAATAAMAATAATAASGGANGGGGNGGDAVGGGLYTTVALTTDSANTYALNGVTAGVGAGVSRPGAGGGSGGRAGAPGIGGAGLPAGRVGKTGLPGSAWYTGRVGREPRPAGNRAIRRLQCRSPHAGRPAVHGGQPAHDGDRREPLCVYVRSVREPSAHILTRERGADLALARSADRAAVWDSTGGDDACLPLRSSLRTASARTR